MIHALAIDTTSDYLSLAVLKGGRPAGSRYLPCGVKATQIVIQEIDGLLTGAGLTAHDLELIVVAVGPGSFTGTRIGMAAAATFGQVLARPVIGVDTLQLLAAQTEPAADVTFHALLNCARDEVYHAAYRWNGVPVALGPIAMTTFGELHRVVGEAPVVARRFDPAPANGEDPLSRFDPMPLRRPHPDAELLLELGLARYREHPAGPFPLPQPIYLKSEAFRKWRR